MISSLLTCKFTGYKKVVFLGAAILIDTLFVYFCPIKQILFRSIFLIVVSFLITKLLHKDSFHVVIFFILLSNYIFVISDMISGNLLSLIYKTNNENIISIELSLFVFSKIIDFVLVLLCILFFKKIYFSISTKYLISIDLIIGFFIVIMILFMEVNGMLQNKNPDYSVQIVKISIYFLLMSVLIIYLFGEICFFYQKEQQRYALDLKNKVLEQQLAFQETSESDLKKIRHDIKNNLANILQLLNENHIEESVKYIYSITSALEATKPAVHCGNNYLDAILNYEIILCKSNNIDAKFEVDNIPDLNIDPMNLSSIFSNILNNAVEANLKLIESERYILLKMFCYKNYLSAIVKNPYKHTITENDGTFKTDKKDKLHHGYGLKSAKSSVERYGGTFKYSYKNNVFTSMIMLPLNTEHK